MITDYTREIATGYIGSQMLYFSAGAGSQTLLNNITTLTGSEFTRVAVTSADFSTSKQVTINSDLNSVQSSGLVLTQFGNFTSATINTGSALQINQLNGSIVCDGTIELSFEQTFTVQ
jgi:hypothetical protein